MATKNMSDKELYEKYQNEKHVFVLSVCGRSSSTAIQRLLNSTNEINIWGEQSNFIFKALNLLKYLDYHSDRCAVKANKEIFIKCMKEHQHDQPYPCAMGNNDITRQAIIAAIVKHLSPVNDIKRFGFKDITVDKKENIKELLKLFPNSYLVFLFRDPLSQWPSVKKLKWWDYGKDLNHFLREYERLAKIYLFFKNLNNVIYIENTGLYKSNEVKKITNFLELPGVNDKLIGKKIYSTKANKVSQGEERTIKRSDAYRAYLKLKSLY